LSRDQFWRDPERLREEVAKHGSMRAAARAHGCNPSTVHHWWKKYGFATPEFTTLPLPTEREPDQLEKWLSRKLGKIKDGTTVESLADEADVSPRRIREALAALGEKGYRVTAETEVRVERVVPAKENLHLDLLKGKTLRFGVVSDTHLGSRECASEVLELAYDLFEREGITKVLHAGDVGAGMGIYRGQQAEVQHRTLDEQIDLLVDGYPVRKGIETLLIGGNHDLEGDAARVGLDLAAAFAARRDDVTYLGPYSAWLEVHGGAWIHLLHGKGGMSYSRDYKALKLVSAYPPGRKPVVLICGHWHVRANFSARGVEVIFPGCTEWQSRFMTRLGLTPDVGFHVLEMTLGDDGSLVQFAPRWFRVWEGRVVG
jgi:predicted phosphodiesterase/transposase-like protein